MIWTQGWLWIVAALLLAALELALPVWFFLGLSLSVALMGILLLLGWFTAGLAVALVVTAVLTGVIWLGLRRMFGPRRSEVRRWTRDINDN
ncbi:MULTISPECIES: hypothetical protein [unclassified Paracoccus (in: a-proteobacteria)]|uniref:hypothetical protein n=1 Tax=unclassified Paracoccus (in: a-proteobacteria) TaxID=2688777 RepID=UPI001E5F9B52|nr:MULTISPECIES: hypothetical protein [unclassified Paracoccus (in: a-proteobacteria)]UXU75696.1 hypothetical protein GB879_004195 [Paracoccus sp. SMMA_5]UXU81601.1 hypothetical protein GB880_004185 [Paracoccus sp. SMMA_5_TC]